MSFSKKIKYKELNPRQKEIYNFQKVSSLFAEYWYTTIKLSDDRMWADFIAVSMIWEQDLKIQLKWRITFGKKYLWKWIHICFINQLTWDVYCYDHDKVIKTFISQWKIANTVSWERDWIYYYSKLSKFGGEILNPYKIWTLRVEA
jgi:hypothetical protein